MQSQQRPNTIESVDTRHADMRHKLLLTISLTVLGILINLLGQFVTNSIGLPIYLDTIGTILAACVGGYVPGILAGFLTNLFKSFSEPTSIYYSALSIAIATLSTYFYTHGYFQKFAKHWLCILSFTLLGGALGSVITWELNGTLLGEGHGEALAQAIYDSGHFSMFFSQLSADVLIDLVDKILSFYLVLGILRVLPTSAFLTQATSQAQSKEQRLHLLSHSLRARLSLFTCVTFLVLALTISIASFVRYRGSVQDQYAHMAYGITSMVDQAVDADRIPAYLEEGESAEGYQETEQKLNELINSSEDVEFVYVYRIEPDGCHVVFDPDTEDLPGMDPGELVAFDEEFMQYVPGMLRGEEVPPIVVHDQYGWLLSIYAPLFDSQGVCQAYAGVDISMSSIMREETIFLTKLLSLFFSFLIVILVLYIYILDRLVLGPINQMATASASFAYTSEKTRVDSMEKLRALQLHSGDEIENLYRALIKTSEDTVRYIDESERKNEVIQRYQTGLIFMLADLVESRDLCTGNHIRNTAAFVRLILAELQKEGLYADQLTPEYVSDVISSAPMHDIGKIQVSDVILNKPGKLTDEEFEIMKKHTTYGSDILDKAIGTFTDGEQGYLKEAKNLAKYHHERWDGRGYPEGLKGEEIPLSARIMAVADVFDALVSKRSYKEPFAFDKALNIIEEESGTHFDPIIVEAFLHIKDQAWEVLKSRETESKASAS